MTSAIDPILSSECSASFSAVKDVFLSDVYETSKKFESFWDPHYSSDWERANTPTYR